MTAEELDKFMEPVRRARALISTEPPWMQDYLGRAVRHGPDRACCGPVACFLSEIIRLRQENSALRTIVDKIQIGEKK